MGEWQTAAIVIGAIVVWQATGLAFARRSYRNGWDTSPTETAAYMLTGPGVWFFLAGILAYDCIIRAALRSLPPPPNTGKGEGV